MSTQRRLLPHSKVFGDEMKELSIWFENLGCSWSNCTAVTFCNGMDAGLAHRMDEVYEVVCTH